MIILSHRGYWLEPAEKNGRDAFLRSFSLGFGTETDVRDHAGELVISHDPPVGGEMTLLAFLALLDGRDLPLAINIKADGLAKRVLDTMRTAGLSRWFVFDMSVPDTVQQLRAGCPVFARRSDWESGEGWHDRCAGVWLDAFDSDWFGPEQVEALLAAGKQVCIVSPELHGRPPLPVWDRLRPLAGRPGVWLCTDRPEEARAAFAAP